MRYLRKSVGKTWRDRIRNPYIRKDKNQLQMLRWFGYVVSMTKDRKSKQILEARAEEKKEDLGQNGKTT